MQPELRMSTQTDHFSLPTNKVLRNTLWVDSEKSTHKVLRNTYMMLGLTMIPTVIGAMMGVSMNFSFMAQHPFMGMIGMLAVMFGLFWGISKNRDSGVGVALLLALTFFMG